MTDKEFRKLKKSELLELLLIQTKENERLKEALEEAQVQLRDRNLYMENAGSIAEASLRVNHIFELAQKAADQYLYNVRNLAGEQDKER